MALELSIFLIILGIAGILYFSGIIFRTPQLFLLGCVLIIGSGALLWGFDGLLLQHQVTSVSDDGVISYTPIVVGMENVGLAMVSLVFVAIGILSALVIDFGGQVKARSNVYHF